MATWLRSSAFKAGVVLVTDAALEGALSASQTHELSHWALESAHIPVLAVDFYDLLAAIFHGANDMGLGVLAQTGPMELVVTRHCLSSLSFSCLMTKNATKVATSSVKGEHGPPPSIAG